MWYTPLYHKMAFYLEMSPQSLSPMCLRPLTLYLRIYLSGRIAELTMLARHSENKVNFFCCCCWFTLPMTFLYIFPLFSAMIFVNSRSYHAHLLGLDSQARLVSGLGLVEQIVWRGTNLWMAPGYMGWMTHSQVDQDTTILLTLYCCVLPWLSVCIAIHFSIHLIIV